MRLFVQSDLIRAVRHRLIWLGVIILLVILLFAGRLADLQLFSGDLYQDLSTSNFIKERQVPALRGRILDRNGVLLADDRSSYSVTVTPAFVKNPESLVVKLASYLDLSHGEVVRLTRAVTKSRGLVRFREYTVRSSVSRNNLAVLASRLSELAGVSLSHSYERYYPLGETFAHVVGYVGRATERDLRENRVSNVNTPVGKHGVELSLDADLRGIDGVKKVVVDSLGLEKTDHSAEELLGSQWLTPPTAGQDVYLTLDTRLQDIAAKSFDRFESGAVLAINPRNGEVLLSYSKPAYDPNLLVNGIPTKMWNRLRDDVLNPLMDKNIQSAYFPGSTIKALVAYAAAREHLVYRHEKVGCAGTRVLGKHVYHCWNHGGHGLMDMRSALKQSCDVFFYEMGGRLGIDKLSAYAFSFGLGQASGIDLAHEKSGRVPTVAWHKETHRRPWNLGDTYNTAIGQGDFMATPVQLANLYAALFNGGHLWRPRLLDHLENRDGDLMKRGESVLSRTLDMDIKAISWVREGLDAAVNEPGGTAYGNGRSMQVTIAGKTGTAQVKSIKHDTPMVEDIHFQEQDHALFVGFSPPENPEIVVVTVAEHGQHGSLAASVVKDVIEGYFNLKQTDHAVGTRSR